MPSEFPGDRTPTARPAGPDAADERERLSRYETLMAVHPDPVFTTDATGALTFVNPAFEELLGYRVDECERADDLHLSDVLAEGDGARVREALTDLVRAEDRVRTTLDVEGVTPDGRSMALECSVGLLPGEDGFAGAAGVFHDVTDERRRAQVFNVMNRALRHNLRHKVDIVTGRAELARERVDDETVAEQLESIADSTRWLGKLGITLRTLQIAIDESLQRDEPVPVKEVVAGAVANVRQDHPEADVDMHVTARGSLEAGRPIELALSNVIENGIVHADDPEAHVDVWVAHGPRDGWLDIHVEDEGPGIPPMEREIVLGEADITQLQHASGIGLWITRWVIEVFDGRIEIGENDPRGSVVTLRLPLADGAGERGD